MPFSGRTKDAYEWFQQRRRELEHEAEIRNGRLRRQDQWELAYYRYPYLLLESDDAIRERFVDVFSNGFDITSEGKIAPTPMMANDARLSAILTALHEETNWRGILTRALIADANAQIRSYFDHGVPLGVRMFGDRTHVKDEWLVKYSKRPYIEEMYKFGRIRIAPASEYAKGSHIKAVKDFEMTRHFKLKALKEVLERKTEVFVGGNRIPIRNGVVPLQLVMDDYYLFSTCREIDRRMPTDFESDAALIIREPRTFGGLLKAALLATHRGWEFVEGDVYYYDPYNDVPRDMDLEFWKYLSYAYQKEHRCVLRPIPSLDRKVNLSAFFVELGSLEHISEVVVPR